MGKDSKNKLKVPRYQEQIKRRKTKKSAITSGFSTLAYIKRIIKERERSKFLSLLSLTP